MRRISLICSLLIVGLVGFSQTKVSRAGAANTVVDARLGAQKNFYPPVYADTTEANLTNPNNIGIDSCSALIYTRNPQAYWRRDCSPVKHWTQIVDAGNISKFISDNSTSISTIDSNTFQICNGQGVCDTFHTNINYNTIQFITDSSVQVCSVDTVSGGVVSICDTINVGSQQTPYIFQNGLWQNGNIVEFGTNPLVHNTTLDALYYKMIFSGGKIYDYPFNFKQAQVFQNSSQITSFLSPSAGNNRLGVQYSGAIYDVGSPGYLGAGNAGYIIASNMNTIGSYGVFVDDASSKLAAIVLHSNDANDNAVSILGSPIGTTHYAIVEGNGLGATFVAHFKTNGNIQFPGYDSLIRNDGVLTKVFGADEFGNVLLGRVNAGSTNSNIGSGFRLAIPSTNNIKTLFGSNTITIDSSSNTNALTIKADTSLLATQYDLTQISTSITADNGLTANTSTNVQLGGTSAPGSALLHDSYINAGVYILQINSTTSGVNTFQVNSTGSNAVAINGTGAAYGAMFTGTAHGGVVGISDGDLAGVVGETETGKAGLFRAISSPTNTIYTVAEFANRAFTTPSAGIGVGVDFTVGTTSIGTFAIANQLQSKWTDPTNATRTSQFIITGVDAGTTRNLVLMDGNGGVSMPGAGNPSATLSVTNTTFNGIEIQTTTGTGISTVVQGGLAANLFILPSSTNTVASVMNVSRGSTGTAGDGIGGSIDFYNKTSGTPGQPLSNQLISKWTTSDNATRTSSFVVKGVLNTTTVDVLTLNANGSIQLRPITATAASAITPAEGMMLFSSSTDATFTSIGFWGYENGAWHKF